MHFLQAMELAFFVFVFISRQQETMIIVSCRKSVLFPIIHQWDIQADLLIQLHSCLLLILQRGRRKDYWIKFGDWNVQRDHDLCYGTEAGALGRGGKQPLLTSCIFRCPSNSSLGMKINKLLYT